MPFVLESLSQALSLASAELDPQQLSVGTAYTGGVDMQKFQRVLFLLLVGNVGAAGTVTAQLQSSASPSFPGTPTSYPGSGLTPITSSNKVATLEIRADQLAAGDRYVRLAVTVSGNPVYVAAIALGGEAGYKPASRQDAANLSQRLVL
jgi:hypothetical protein